MASQPSAAQLNLIAKLAAEIGEKAPAVATGKAASEAIDQLLAQANVLRTISRKAENAAKRDALEESGVLTWKQQCQVANGVTGKGKWLSAKAKDSQYGTQYKGVFEFTDGRKVWCSIPKSLFAAVDPFRSFSSDGTVLALIPGIVGTLTVEVEPSDDDPFFAFGKRPKFVKDSTPEGSKLAQAEAAWAEAKAQQAADAAAQAKFVAEQSWLDRFDFVNSALAADTDEGFDAAIQSFGAGLTLDYVTEYSRDTAKIARTQAVRNLFRLLAGGGVPATAAV